MTNESIGPRRRRGFRWLNVLWLFAAALLLAPLVAMQFTDEVNWTLSDFLAFGLMLTVALGCLAGQGVGVRLRPPDGDAEQAEAAGVALL